MINIYIHNLKFKMLIVTEYYIININISQCYLVEQMNCLLTFFFKYGARMIQTILANLVIFLVPFQKHLLIPYLRPVLSQETIILFNNRQGPTSNDSYPTKLSFRMEEQIKCFPDQVKLKEFIITKPLLYEMLKGLI